jgi:hypothetical protein
MPAKRAKAGELPPCVLFIPYGDVSSRLTGGNTHGTGVPDSKAIDVETSVVRSPQSVVEGARQLQPERAPELNIASAVEKLHTLATRNHLASRVRVYGGYDKGLYLNVDYNSSDIKQLWNRLRRNLRMDHRLARCTIICCQGKAGWDDYLLLHHYDPDVPVDKLNRHEARSR